MKEKIFFTQRKGLAPVLANLLLIAITVVGGTITIGSAHENYNSSQISTTTDIEFLEILGYDTRTACSVFLYIGFEVPCPYVGEIDEYEYLKYDERIAVYIVNHSTKKILLSEIRFGGTVYNATSSPALTHWDDNVSFVPGQYAIMDTGNSLLTAKNNEIQPGQTVTVILDLDSSIKVGRTIQFHVTTGNGAIYVSDIKIGEHRVE